MSSFINFLKNLLSGAFSFVGGLFGSKKAQDAIAPAPRKARNSGYFLELDDAKGVGSPATAAKVSQEVAVPQPSPAKAVKSKKEKAPIASAEPTASKPVSTNAALNLPQPSVATFAPQYLAPNGRSNGRRRPGANMSSFLDMARQMKTAN